MTNPSADWDRLAAYLAVVRTGSLSGAARALGLAQPTVRRQVEALERAVGTALFARGPSGLTPIGPAEALRRDAEAMEAAAASFRRAAAAEAGEVAGPVRVTTSAMVGAEVLPGLLAPLLAAHPGLTVEVVADDAVKNLLRRDADVAVRFAEPGQDALVARRVRPVAVGLFAAPAYVARRGLPGSPAELAGHALVGDDRLDRVARGFALMGWPLPDRLAFRSDSDLAQLGAVRAGIGIGVAQEGIAARDGLVRALPGSLPMPAWVVTHEDLRGVARVRAVFDALVAALG